MKKLLIILASLIVILLLALLVVPKLVNWNRIIASKVKDATGRDLVFDSAVTVSIFPNLTFSASGVHLSNALGTEHPEMVSMGAISGKLKLLPLLGRRVVLDSFVMDDLSVHLEVDKAGRANWDFGTGSPSPSASKQDRSKGGSGLPIKDLSLGDVRLSRGKFTFADATTGQTLNAKEVNLTVALANLSSPLNLGLQLILNNEPVKVELSVNAPRGVLEGPSAAINAAVVSKFVTTGYQGGMQRQPVTGLDGTFDLNVPSVGRLAAWLGKPLDASQPDPGPLKVHATFEGKGAKVALTQATIEGSALKAKATGSYDGSGAIAKVALNVESETLDIDRYLPPAVPAKKSKSVPAKPKQAATGDIMAAFSEKPIDLSPLRQTEADVRIAIRGIKAMGFAIGQIDFTTILKDGLLTANLNELRLYGGNVNGTFKLDGSGDALGVEAQLKVDRVRVDKLASAATGGPSPVTGIASGNLRATARGASPRRLVESMQGGIDFDLGGVDIQNAPGGAISELKVALDLPGIERSPTLKSSVVYNKQRVTLDLVTDPLKKVLSDDRFMLKASVDSKLVRAGYDGKIQQRPVPGLDGTFNLDVPSVGGLASWLGQPLDKSQPDPGPLKMRAVFAGDGAKVTLKEATLEGEALKAKASGSYDGSGKTAKVALKVESETLDLDRYLPAAPEKKAQTAKDMQASAVSGDPLATLSDTPFDLSGLKKTDAEVTIAIGGIKAMGYRIGRVDFTTSLVDGLLNANLHKLSLYDGNVTGRFKLDGSGKALAVDTTLNMDGVKVDELVKTATQGTLLMHGTASGNLSLQGRGASPKSMVESIRGKLAFNLGGVDLKDAPVGSISGMNVDVDLPGIERQTSVKGSVIYNKEKVDLDLKLDSIRAALSGKPLTVKTAVTSKLLNASYNGSVQRQPTPGLDGALTLDVTSVGGLMTWIGKPLDKAQPDPGPLKLQAAFVSKGSQTSIKEAAIEGKALQAKASGSLDNSGTIPVLTANLRVQKADLNAYLPPPETPAKAAPKPTPPEKTGKQEPSGWSEEPLDFAPLSQANADIKIDIDSLRYREITIQPGRITVALKKGVLRAATEEFHVGDGTITSTVNLDGSAKAARLDYQVVISGLEARPLLKTLADNDRLSGKTEFQAKGSAQGQNQKELVGSLNGSGQFKFLDGAIHGINIPATLRKVKTLGFGKETAEEVKTDFAELSGSFVIKDGILENRDLKMLAPLIRLSGEGRVPMPQRSIDYNVTAKLVASLEGQGGKDALAGIPIPIRVQGEWDNISYSVDWKKTFSDISADPERLKNLPQNLRDASKNFGVDLPLPKLLDTGKGTSPLEQLLPMQKKPAETPAEATRPKTSEEKPAAQPVDPSKILKDLFKK